MEIIVPVVGESITEVVLASWRKKDGDLVKLDEVIGELESDKATFDIPAPAAGVLRLVAKEGDTIAIGGLLGRIEASGTATASAVPAAEAAAPVATPAAAPVAAATPTTYTMIVPAVGESITEVTINTWHKNDGDFVTKDEILCDVDSDKATFELPAEASGILHIVAVKGSTLPIGGVICTISGSNAPVATSQAASAPAPVAAPAAAPTPVASAAPAAGSDFSDPTVANVVSPVVAAILAERGLTPADVKGTGPNGKITKDDAHRATKQAAPAATAPAAAAKAEATGNRGEERVKMTSLRKTISRRLVAVKNETAMLTTFNEVDMKPIMDLRNKYKDKFKDKHAVGLGFMSFFTKACSIALQEFPSVNAYIDGDEIINHNFVDISIAVSAPRGLVVPVIRNAEQMNFAEIEKEVVRLAGLARDNKLSIEQMTGGTFTITNGGIFGSMLSTPIINAPQSAILGMHNIVERAMVVNGEIVIRPIMYVALSYDHRIIDGRESVGFLVRVKQLLEDPTRILLDV